MTPTKILIGQMLMVFGIVVGGAWLATEWTAAQLGFQPRLGVPWFAVLGLPVYVPWQFAEWWYVYESYAPDIFTRAGRSPRAAGCWPPSPRWWAPSGEPGSRGSSQPTVPHGGPPIVRSVGTPLR